MGKDLFTLHVDSMEYMVVNSILYIVMYIY